MSAAPRKPQPQPWPMKWIILAIAVFVVGYTLVNLYFRKPGRGYRPYQDAQDRATTSRLLAAGWHKLPVDSRRPLEKPGYDAPAAVARELAGLGDLAEKFAEKPRLVATIDKVVAPAAVARGEPCTIFVTASLKDLKGQVGELALFRRDHELVLVPAIENLPGTALLSRWNDSTYAVSFPTSDLPPGRYTMRVVALGPAATWSFDVR